MIITISLIVSVVLLMGVLITTLITYHLREEERVQEEIEKAKWEAECEEFRYHTALKKAREEVGKAKGKELDELNERIKLLESQLKEAQERKERVICRAQQIKAEARGIVRPYQ